MTRLPGIPDETIVDMIPPGALDGLGIVQAVPVVQVRWYDERAGCKIAHRYEAGELQGKPDDYTGCWAYGPAPAGGGCLMNGRHNGRARSACLFHEPEDSPAWQRLRANVLLELPDGTTAVTSRAGAAQIAADLGAVIVGAETVTVSPCRNGR